MLEDEFGKDDEKWKESEYQNLLRADLILDLRAQIEEESRKITNQGQSKKSSISFCNIMKLSFMIHNTVYMNIKHLNYVSSVFDTNCANSC